MKGWHEVREDDPMAGGALLAAIVAMQYENVVWLQSPQASISIINVLDWSPTHIFQVDRIDHMFSVVSEVHRCVDLVVVDNLAQFAPKHPQNVQISSDVERYWFAPECPVIVLNQVRHPLPPGGAYWRSMLRTKQTLSSTMYYPDLYSQLCPDGRWLVWERSMCIRCGYQTLKGDLLACPECNYPWISRKPFFGDYQESEGLCKQGMKDWPFLVERTLNV